MRYVGEIDNRDTAVIGLVKKVAAKYQRVTFCYEAGPTGYGLHRLITGLGHDCMVVAPSLIPMKASDRVKTNRRDALNLVKLLRAGELTRVWVPDERHEAMRDLTRAREAAVSDLVKKHQQVMSLMLRLGRNYPGKRNWTRAHMLWLASQKLEHIEQRMVLEEGLLAIREAQERIKRLAEAIRAAVPEWSLAALVPALMALRGIDFISATAFLAEVGDLSRFQTARQFMGYLGLVSSERSTGDTIIRGPITKAGNRRARRILVECSWSYRHPARSAKTSLPRSMPYRVSPRDRLESPMPAHNSLSRIVAPGQTEDSGGHRNCSRAVGLHLGYSARRRCAVHCPCGLRPADAGDRNRPRNDIRATVGAKPRQGNSRLRFVADPFDRRPCVD